jgi:hypothetical protein
VRGGGMVAMEVEVKREKERRRVIRRVCALCVVKIEE